VVPAAAIGVNSAGMAVAYARSAPKPFAGGVSDRRILLGASG
jgi:hypothetical protein